MSIDTAKVIKKRKKIKMNLEKNSPTLLYTDNTSDDKLVKMDTHLASTITYLSGMIHSECPPGLLPRFSSWSLCSIGKYSDYNSYNGLGQAGFLSGHNHLIPWDIYAHSEQSERKKSKIQSNILQKKSMKGKKSAIHFDLISRKSLRLET
jgi:hypothetical protein